MFNWATEKLEKLSQTVAPPPDDPTSRFVYCVQKNDEAGAQGCLAEIDPLHTIVQSTKGTTPLHLACCHSMMNLIRQIMAIPGASIDVTDAAGNTPLHHASMSTDAGNAVNVVRMLVTEYNAPVATKNWQGQTPYDVATLNGIRQYLLPIQLQQETQQAIDNGGVGLPPGIDMGGLRISNPAMPPPPIGGMGAPPTPPTAPPHMLATPSPNMPPSAHTAPPVAQPTAPQSAPNAPAPSSGQLERSASCSSAPSSGNSAKRSYSRSGSSSAAVLSQAKFRPDGFHSSSSDVTLQKKYGHSSHGTPAAAVPPPPSSGNSTGPPLSGDSSGGSNPYAAGSSAFGSVNRYGAAAGRYPGYGAGQSSNVTPPVSNVTPPVSGGYTGVPQPAQVPSYAVFQPGAQTQTTQQQPAYQQSFPSVPQQAPTTPFMSPPPYQQQPQQQAYQQPQQQPAYQQQPVTQQPQQMNAYQQPPAQQIPQQPVQQQPSVAPAQPPMPGPYPMAHTMSTGNASAASAEEVFGSPSIAVKKDDAPAVPAAEPATTRTVTEDSARSSISSAQELFATSVGEEANVDSGDVQQAEAETNVPSSEGDNEATPAVVESSANKVDPPQLTDPAASASSANGAGTAADVFGSNGAGSTQPEPAAVASSPTLETAKADTGESALQSTDGLDDVPLEEVPLSPDNEDNAVASSTDQAAAFSSVGLPPPPFSARQ